MINLSKTIESSFFSSKETFNHFNAPDFKEFKWVGVAFLILCLGALIFGITKIVHFKTLGASTLGLTIAEIAIGTLFFVSGGLACLFARLEREALASSVGVDIDQKFETKYERLDRGKFVVVNNPQLNSVIVYFQGANRNQIFLGDFFQSAINKADSYVKEEVKKGVLTQQLAKDQLCLRSTRVSFLE